MIKVRIIAKMLLKFMELKSGFWGGLFKRSGKVAESMESLTPSLRGLA